MARRVTGQGLQLIPRRPARDRQGEGVAVNRPIRAAVSKHAPLRLGPRRALLRIGVECKLSPVPADDDLRARK